MTVLSVPPGIALGMADEAEHVTRVLFTLAEAVTRLDPPIALRTLQALVAGAGLRSHGTRPCAVGRPPALFDSADLDRLHAEWVRGRISARRPAEG